MEEIVAAFVGAIADLRAASDGQIATFLAIMIVLGIADAELPWYFLGGFLIWLMVT